MIRVNLIKPGRLAGVSLERHDLIKIGAKAIDVIQKRCARGVNVNDRPSRPLSPGYRRKKVDKGKPGIRDLMSSGSMLGALTITEATNSRVVVGFTRQAELIKAQKNDDRDPWFGLSRNDEGQVGMFADRILLAKK
jgi:hypothetical protein